LSHRRIVALTLHPVKAGRGFRIRLRRLGSREMLDQRLDPKRERWINAGFVLVTVLVAVVLFIIAGKFALDQSDAGADDAAPTTSAAKHSRSR
jgi:hypothetical protein